MLAAELDPNDENSSFGNMMIELNSIVSSVFPNTALHAKAILNGAHALKPSFEVEMASNIKTSIEYQGTGIRSAVFGLLRFREKWLSERGYRDRSLIIGFEEPEIYLHPSAVKQMRNTIYELSSKHSQIVATTRSPFLIDISRKPRQILNSYSFDEDHSIVLGFSVTKKFEELQNDDKDYIKMLLKVDDNIAKIFFTKKAIIIEGDTEEIVFKEAID